MAKDIRTEKNPVTSRDKKKKVTGQSDSTFLESLDRFFDQRHSWLIWVFMGITLLFSLLLFDPKVSLSGDDSFYINRASEFIKSFKYPAFQGPLYPMVLGLVVAVFGISLTPLKLVSLASMLAFIYLSYKSFCKRVPATILVASMFLISINSYLLYYASQTYSEAFYIFMQALLLLVFFRKFIDQEKAGSVGDDVRRHLLLAICLLALTLTRSIGYSAVIAVAGYFLLKGQWKNLAMSVIAFGLMFILFQGVKYVAWHEGGLQFSTQGSGLMNKDYYNPQDGKEDLGGMVKRLVDNSNLYLSKHFMYMIGYRTQAPTLTPVPAVTLLVYLLAFLGLGLTYRKNNYLFFTGLMTGAFLLVTFVVLQAKWDQGRLIVPAFFMLLLLLLSTLYYGSQLRKFRVLQFILPLVVVIAFLQTLGASTLAIGEARKESGRFGGLTPDWKHYLQASEWAAVNLPKEAVIACRKPSISFVYGKGRNFYGLMQMPTYNSGDFFNRWKSDPASLVAFSYKDFEGKQMPPEVYQVLKRNMVAQFITAESVFFVDRFPDSLKMKTISGLNTMGIKAITLPDSLMVLRGKDDKASTLIYPDSLLNILVKNNVSHVLTANIRRNSLVKNGQTVNTVERFISFIEDKYPGFLSRVMQIGSDDNEPASILKLNYEVTGVKPEQK